LTNVTTIKSGNTYKEGTYKVGTDIPAGEYKLKADSDGFGGYVAVEKAPGGNGGISNIKTNDNFSKSKYIRVSNGDYLKVSSATFKKS
jgi:hypothetical protein